MTSPTLLPDDQRTMVEFWLTKLDDELSRRRALYKTYRDAVDGEHDMPEGRIEQRFRGLAGLATTNLCGLVIEATAERMSIEGIREAGVTGFNADAWDVFLDSNFDEWSEHAITDALICGRAFISESAGPSATLAYESPTSVVVAYEPNTQIARAALKMWQDEWTGDVFATLYFPGAVLKYEMRKEYSVAHEVDDSLPAAERWIPRASEEELSRNPLGRIPFHELQNRPLGKVRSEIADLLVPQKALNQTMYNLQAISEYGAFRQKWATGVEIVRNPVTNEPLDPFNSDVTKMFLSASDTARFGDFEATDMKPHIELAREIAWHIARISRLPVSYFLTDVSNIGTDTLALLVSGLVSKCQRRILGYEGAFEQAITNVLTSQGKPPLGRLEIKWRDMETRSMAQGADAAVKLTNGTNPVITNRMAQEKYLNLTPEEIEREEIYRREQQAELNMAAMVAAAAGNGPGQQEGQDQGQEASNEDEASKAQGVEDES